jgi:glycosyltransferase involved in cell wall biosynthesis
MQEASREELLTTLAGLQTQNERLVEALCREKRATRDAQLRLEELQGSWTYRVCQLLLGRPTGRRRRFLRSIRHAYTLYKDQGASVLWDDTWRGVCRLVGIDVPPKTAPIGPCPDEMRQSLYERWIKSREPSAADLDRQRKTHLSLEPLISIIVPVYRTPLAFLTAMIESVLAQTYSNWQLCLVDGGSNDSVLHSVLESHAYRDSRVVIKHLTENRGIAGNTNAALELATGEYVAFLDHDDTLAPFALYEVANAIGLHPDADLLYSDEDKIDEEGHHRHAPFFKPAWSPETLRSHNYICHLAVHRHELVRRLGGIRAGFDGSQDHDLILRVTERCRQIVHIPQVLYHWRDHSASTARHATVKPEAAEAGRKAVREHLHRLGLVGEVEDNPRKFGFQVKYPLPRRPLVSILIPSKDAQPTLEACLKSLERSAYRDFEVLVIENNSTEKATFDYYRQLASKPEVRVLTWDGPFNYAAINNWGAAQARGEVLLLLNNDTEAINPDWMERMLEHAIHEEVGGVGAKLFFPDGTIQHAGVVVGLGGVANHGHQGFPAEDPGDRARLFVTHNVSAVTAACLMLRKDVFDSVEGFDERFAVAFNDVDLCLKIRARGKYLIWTPFAQLWHHESKTRGREDTPDKKKRFAGEIKLFYEKWGDFIAAGDPYYNPNLSLSDLNFTADAKGARKPFPRAG